MNSPSKWIYVRDDLNYLRVFLESNTCLMLDLVDKLQFCIWYSYCSGLYLMKTFELSHTFGIIPVFGHSILSCVKNQEKLFFSSSPHIYMCVYIHKYVRKYLFSSQLKKKSKYYFSKNNPPNKLYFKTFIYSVHFLFKILKLHSLMAHS